MYYKDYAEPYLELQEPTIEIVLKDRNSSEIEDKIIIGECDFDYILSQIPLNDDGEYIALAYHQNVDFPWERLEPEYWTMDYLKESLEQVLYVKKKMKDDFVKDICEELARIIQKAIDSGKLVLIRRA